MRRFIACALLASFGFAGAASAQQQMLDLLPEETALAVLMRHPNDLRARGDKFLRDSQVNAGMRPSQLFDLALDILKIRNGVDFDRPGGAIVLRPEGKTRLGLQELLSNLVVAVPFIDLDVMAENFGLQKGKLTRGKITMTGGPVPWVVAKEKHVFLAGTEISLNRLLKSSPINAKLSSEQKKSQNQADILVHFGVSSFRDDWKEVLKKLERDLDEVDGPQEKAALANLFRGLGAVEFGQLAFRIGDGRDRDGLSVSALATFDPAVKEARELLTYVGGGAKASTLSGLPEGNVVLAQAWAGKGDKNALFARALVHYLLKNFLELKQITSPTDRSGFLGIFNEVWQRLEGNRVGVYLNSDEAKHGLFSLVAILDTADARKFLGDMRVLAKIGDGTLDLSKQSPDNPIDIPKLIKDLDSDIYAVRASATTKLRLIGEPALPYLRKVVQGEDNTLEVIRRAERLISQISEVGAERRKELLSKELRRYARPTFEWIAAAEKRQEESIDIVHIKLAGGYEAAFAASIKQYLGPDWDKMRVAVLGKQVVLLLGSETELFDQAIRNVKHGKPGLAAGKRFDAFAKQKPPGAGGELHASLGTLMSLVTQGNQPLRPSGAMSSASLTAGENCLQLDVLIPMAEFRVVGQKILK